MRKLPLLLTAFLLALAVPDEGASHGEQKHPPAPPARRIPGINAEDKAPHGCVSCHKNNPERNMDARFSTWMKEWQVKAPAKLVDKARKAAPEGMKIEGKHPEVKADLTTAEIPKACLECHAKTPKNKKKAGPPFARLVHLIHLTGGEKNHFMTHYQGECTYCHKLDDATGQWSLGSGTETAPAP